jgi:hypothetical protein
MFNLTDSRRKFKWNGYPLELNDSFDNVLLFLELLDDEDYTGEQKMLIGCEMIVEDEDFVDSLPHAEQTDLTITAFRFITDIDLLEESEEAYTEPSMDFEQDAERIYSSFLEQYHIDLIDQQGIMSWSKFSALLKNVGSETALGQAIHHRTCEVPKKTQHNGDEVSHIRKLKREFQLKGAKYEKRRAEEANRRVMAYAQSIINKQKNEVK